MREIFNGTEWFKKIVLWHFFPPVSDSPRLPIVVLYIQPLRGRKCKPLCPGQNHKTKVENLWVGEQVGGNVRLRGTLTDGPVQRRLRKRMRKWWCLLRRFCWCTWKAHLARSLAHFFCHYLGGSEGAEGRGSKAGRAVAMRAYLLPELRQQIDSFFLKEPVHTLHSS